MSLDEFELPPDGGSRLPTDGYDQTSFSCEGDVQDIVTRLLHWGKRIPWWALNEPNIEQYIQEGRGCFVGYFDAPQGLWHMWHNLKREFIGAKKGILYFDGSAIHKIIYRETRMMDGQIYPVHEGIDLHYELIYSEGEVALKKEQIPGLFQDENAWKFI